MKLDAVQRHHFTLFMNLAEVITTTEDKERVQNKVLFFWRLLCNFCLNGLKLGRPKVILVGPSVKLVLYY